MFYKIIREELERENIIWDMFAGRTYIAPVRRARHRVVWRLSEEMKLRKITIAHLIELDESTVRGILKDMKENNGALRDDLETRPRKKTQEQRI